ncbi:MAG: hypothetical protein CMI17_07765 [Opitutaceae bacterium]|nr:hypothetical protein [Opitutaceae bacterium]
MNRFIRALNLIPSLRSKTHARDLVIVWGIRAYSILNTEKTPKRSITAPAMPISSAYQKEKGNIPAIILVLKVPSPYSSTSKFLSGTCSE